MSGPHRWFHLRVQAELKARGWSARELARRADCSVSTFTRLGRDHGIALGHAVRIADALGRPLGDLIAPIKCETCQDMPPAGFACQACGAKGEAPRLPAQHAKPRGRLPPGLPGVRG